MKLDQAALYRKLTIAQRIKHLYLNLTGRIELYQLDMYYAKVGGFERSLDISEYFIDRKGRLFSKNQMTYETKQGKLFLKCSDNCVVGGKVINTLRDRSYFPFYNNSFFRIRGRKFTVSRDKLINAPKLGKVVVSKKDIKWESISSKTFA